MDETMGQIPYTLADGRDVMLSVNYGLLFKLREQNKAAYKRYNEAFKLMMTEPDFASAEIIYAAYLMGLIAETGNVKDAMDEFEFLSFMPRDRELNMNVMSKLVLPNRAKASTKRS